MYILYISIKCINKDLIKKLDKLFDIANKDYTIEELYNIINDIVNFLNFYNIDNLNAFDLKNYYTEKIKKFEDTNKIDKIIFAFLISLNRKDKIILMDYDFKLKY